jgi:hypothetical protein
MFEMGGAALVAREKRAAGLIEDIPTVTGRSFFAERVEGPVAGTQFLIHSAVAGATGMFLLQSVPGPYTEFSPFAHHIRDAALRRNALAQQAWLAIDQVGGDNEADAYRFIGKVLADLAPGDATVLVHPERLVSYPLDTEMRLKLSKAEVD